MAIFSNFAIPKAHFSSRFQLFSSICFKLQLFSPYFVQKICSLDAEHSYQNQSWVPPREKMLYEHIEFSCQCNIVVCTVHMTFFDIVHTTILHWHSDLSCEKVNQSIKFYFFKAFNTPELPDDWSIRICCHLLNQEGVWKIVCCKSLWCTTFKPYHNWLRNVTLHDMNQS